MTFLDLFENFVDNANTIEKSALEKKKEITDKRKDFIDPATYMEDHLGASEKEKEDIDKNGSDQS